MPASSGSLVMAIKQQAKENPRPAYYLTFTKFT
jgi:hypothetical protein